jgi:hypothetical protein
MLEELCIVLLEKETMSVEEFTVIFEGKAPVKEAKESDGIEEAKKA